jgi:hypothetical protein
LPSTTQAQCDIPVLSSEFNAEVHYVTVQCNSTGVAFNPKQVEILAIPPNGTADVAYQIAGNRGSVGGVGGVANTGNCGLLRQDQYDIRGADPVCFRRERYDKLHGVADGY